MPNTKGKTRPVNDPYETFAQNGWTWRVLKHYQTPEGEKKNPYARVFCAVSSPFTSGAWEYGDVYISDIPNARRLFNGD